MDLGLNGRAVVVTGASSGIGLATARMLLAEGAAVAACARDGDRLRAALAPYAEAGPGRLHAASCDVTRAEQVEEFVAASAGALGGRIDGLVCNAGRSLMAPLDETTDDQIRAEFELKIFGTLHAVRAARPHLADSADASIVVVNAILARQPEARLAVTSSARAALLNLTRTLAGTLGPQGTRVNSVLLGLIDTGQWRRRHRAAAGGLGYKEWTRELAADRGIPLGRLGRPEEVAFPIVSLLSPLSGYTTGATLDIGGGIARHA
ncbi:SDR family oxidoreductase [Actinomadura macra]|uniref:SDR family oxidoreductase n=1 Tax=Actinomadura macra TaxID=46164 RepID=UPI00082E2A9E|nr:SDR family oxidoreductase [Actinomadura macra]